MVVCCITFGSKDILSIRDGVIIRFPFLPYSMEILLLQHFFMISVRGWKRLLDEFFMRGFFWHLLQIYDIYFMLKENGIFSLPFYLCSVWISLILSSGNITWPLLHDFLSYFHFKGIFSLTNLFCSLNWYFLASCLQSSCGPYCFAFCSL